MTDFKKWPKIYRHGKGDYIVTEKIDGTNSQIHIINKEEDNSINNSEIDYNEYCLGKKDSLYMFAGSRNRYINTKNDNYGFARWVKENSEELFSLGVGRHYGEWAGEGIQKNPHNIDGKKFFLFNTERWNIDNKPSCCEIVPVIVIGNDISVIDKAMEILSKKGSLVGSSGKPEGIISFHYLTRVYQKSTFNNKDGKWYEQ